MLEAGARFYEYQPARFHCKYLLVDDCWASVGSANLTNRSMGLDSELNLSWDAALPDAAAGTARAIRRVRVSLLAEHLGCVGARAVRALVPIAGLVMVCEITDS